MATDLTDDRRLTASAQVHFLQNLSQQAAAFLAGVTARTLRDHPQIPRHSDGSYDGRKILQWASRRVELDDIDDSMMERILTAIDWMYQDTKAPFVQLADDMVEDFGEIGYAYLGRALAEYWRESYQLEHDDRHCRPPTREELQGLGEFEHERLIERRAKNGLRIRAVCEKCGRVRHGRRWQLMDVPDGFATSHDHCPRCRKKV